MPYLNYIECEFKELFALLDAGELSQDERAQLVPVRVNERAPTVISKSGDTLLIRAARRGRTDTVAHLAGLSGAALEATNGSGNTAVFAACQAGHVEALRALHGAGASLDTPNSKGATPACIASALGHVDVLRYLQTHGADLETPSRDGFTPAAVAQHEVSG